jgi:hypothetical protein
MAAKAPMMVTGTVVAGTRVARKFYALIKGRGYWRPTKRMKELGFSDIRCGPDGPAAWTIAGNWNERWQRVRRGEEAAQRRCRLRSSRGSRPN